MAKTSDIQQLKLQVHGLFTNPSTFSEVPIGALSVADNIVLDRENFVMPRRGMNFYGTTFGSSGVQSMYTYASTLLTLTQDGKLHYDSDNNGTWVAYSPTFTVPNPGTAGSRVRSAESNKNFYFLTSKGTYKLDAVTNQPRTAGAPQGLGGVGTVTGTTGFVPINTYVAYRVVWGYQDANENLILGAPSDRIIVGNAGLLVNVTSVSGSVLTVGSTSGLVVGMTFQTSGSSQTGTISAIGSSTITLSGGTWTGVTQGYAGYSKNVSLNFQIPAGIDGTWFYQVYRSLPSVDYTLDAAAQPNDELQQTYEGVPTSSQLTAKSVTVTDATPNSLLQGYLYTNLSQGGITQANYQPPFATDICFYNNYVFYANTRTVYRFNLSLLSSGAPLGIQVGDTLTVTAVGTGGVTFTLTGASTENATTGAFQVFSTGNPALDIQNTSTSLVRIINEYASNSIVSAYYTSSFGDIPGQMMLQANSLDLAGFYLTTSRPSAWSQVLPTSGQTVAASAINDASQSRLYWSRLLQPEAVPLSNYVEVGSRNQPINRIIPLRDGIIILKQDGVYRLSGSDPTSFVVTGLDNSIRILADNTASVLDNQVYFLSDQGVAAASDNEVVIFSRPIERDILKLTSPNLYPNFKELAFATTYNADRKYILHMPVAGTDTYCQQQFCYNTITNTWTRWTRPTLSGIVDIRDNKLYFGGPSLSGGVGAWVYQERKDFQNSDFADESYNVTITAVSGNVLTLSSTAFLAAGMTITQAATSSSDSIASISGSTVTMTTNNNPWATGAAVAFTPISCVLQTIQIDGDNAGTLKQFPEVSFIFSDANFTNMYAYFSSDQAPGQSAQILSPQSQGSWGLFAWGGASWGGSASAVQARIRTLVPQQQQRANWIIIKLSLAQCFSSFGYSGLSLSMNEGSTRQRGSN